MIDGTLFDPLELEEEAKKYIETDGPIRTSKLIQLTDSIAYRCWWRIGLPRLRRGSEAQKNAPKIRRSGFIWYQINQNKFTVQEAEEKSQEMRAENKAAIPQILGDGFIPFPLFTRNRLGELVEKAAYLPPTFEPSCSEGFYDRHRMETNIYVPSYERAGVAGTIKMLDKFGVTNYYICIDPSQYLKYREHYPLERLVIRDISFREEDMVDECSSAIRPISMAGHAPLCNFTLALSKSLGETHFTFSDDDFVGLAMKAKKGFQSLQPGEIYNKDDFYRCSNIEEEYGFNFQDFWNGLEQLTKKMRNPGFVGLERFGTVFSLPVCFRTGTRVYSFYVTANATQIHHTGRQNNDVITSMLHSKHGNVNVLFEGISYNSEATQSGGGQTNLYQRFGTLDKGSVLVKGHPDYTSIIFRYSRIHHAGNFTNYNKLRLVGKLIESPSDT